MTAYDIPNKLPSQDNVSKTYSGCQFHFVNTQHPNDDTRRKIRRDARAHAVARGLEAKRKSEQNAGNHFRVHSLKEKSGQLVLLSTGLPNSLHPPDLESMKFQFLFTYGKTEHGIEPSFLVSDELVLSNLRLLLENGHGDSALISAVQLTVKFTLSARIMDDECLRYQGDTLASIRQRMAIPERAVSESTLAAILLLAGVEVSAFLDFSAQLGIPRKVQLHMGAIRDLIHVCQKNGICLSDSLKRAIFWSDLNGSVMAGSSRFFDHTTFSELQWKRDSRSSEIFALPPGFETQSDLLDDEFIEVLRDVYALQCIRETSFFGAEGVMTMAHIDNHQASVQSRLVALSSGSRITECCHIAAYLCSTMLRCKLWRTSTAPSHLSARLLHKLWQSNNDPTWDGARDLLAWLLYVGGAFAPTGRIRSNYIALLHMNRETRLRELDTSWLQLLATLKQFIWSEKAFAAQVKAFWSESLC